MDWLPSPPMKLLRTGLLRSILLGSLILAPASAFSKAAEPSRTTPAAPAKGAKTVPWSSVSKAAVTLLETQHYLRRVVDGDFSKRALERYLEILDPYRLYFLEADVEGFRKAYGTSFGLELKAGRSDAAFAIYGRLVDRMSVCSEMVRELLDESWEFKEPWLVEISRERSPWPKDDVQARRLWREQIGSELLSEVLKGVSRAMAKEYVRKHYEVALKTVSAADEKERWSNALLAMARACDAHSDYLTQEELDDEESELRLTRVGIGVTLDGDRCGVRVAGLLPGGPAHRDGRLQVNDRIVAVAEARGPFSEIDGLPLRKALSLIRGQKGSTVKLKIAPAKASDPSQRTVIALQRDEMRSSEGEAYGKIIERDSAQGPIRYGWIGVPGFYGDDTEAIGKRRSSVSRDVSILVTRMKAEKVRGLVLDLRGNRGGLLDEAVEMGGIFLGRLPIVIARSQPDGAELLSPIKLRRPQYDGPLVVLTDRESASASELLSGALQDYKRAVVIGGEQTFGKGSVQMTVPLGEYLSGKNRQPVGGLALTVGKFYRVDGRSTQIFGVRPDIVLPSTADYPGGGESALVDPLPYDTIPSGMSGAPKVQIAAAALAKLASQSAARVAASAEFRAISEEKSRNAREYDENVISLEEGLRRRQTEEAHIRYSGREARIADLIPAARHYRLLLEDTKLKRLKVSATDSLASSDPESLAIEAETLNVLEDLSHGAH